MHCWIWAKWGDTVYVLQPNLHWYLWSVFPGKGSFILPPKIHIQVKQIRYHHSAVDSIIIFWTFETFTLNRFPISRSLISRTLACSCLCLQVLSGSEPPSRSLLGFCLQVLSESESDGITGFSLWSTISRSLIMVPTQNQKWCGASLSKVRWYGKWSTAQPTL